MRRVILNRMEWVVYSIGAYFFNAVVSIVDKYLLSSRIPHPVTYMFYTGILSAGVLFLIPLFGFSFLPLWTAFIALFSGAIFLLSLFFFYEGVRRWEVSRVAPIVGSFSAIVTLALSGILLQEALSIHAIVAFVLLIAAGIILSIEKTTVTTVRWEIVGLALVSAVCLALTFITSKLVFASTTFTNGFVWMRMGSFFLALVLLAIPALRRAIFATHNLVSPSSIGLVFVNKAIGAVGFLLLNIAIATGFVSLVNALKSSEFAFVFVLTIILSFAAPRFLREQTTSLVIIQKVSGIALVITGIFLLYLS